MSIIIIIIIIITHTTPQVWRDQQAGRRLLRKTLDRLHDPDCPESYCYQIRSVRTDTSSPDSSPLHALYAALVQTSNEPNWLDVHRSLFETFIEMVVNDITSMHLLLCTLLPSDAAHIDTPHPGWALSLASLRQEWRRRYHALALDYPSQCQKN